jgi:hypothetical protein
MRPCYCRDVALLALILLLQVAQFPLLTSALDGDMENRLVRIPLPTEGVGNLYQLFGLSELDARKHDFVKLLEQRKKEKYMKTLQTYKLLFKMKKEGAKKEKLQNTIRVLTAAAMVLGDPEKRQVYNEHGLEAVAKKGWWMTTIDKSADGADMFDPKRALPKTAVDEQSAHIETEPLPHEKEHPSRRSEEL